ncbi:MAG: FMN-binding protein [Actinomycetota bacterium]|nr:FMN-binding protein [Actinomycetota bacterium]
MKRAPFVIGATGLGLGLLFSFHTTPVHVSIVSSTGGGTGPTGSSPSSTPGATTAPAATTPVSRAPSATSPPTTAAGSRSATGQLIQYLYGDVQLKVFEQGTRIEKILVVTEDATDPRSAEINSQAIPMLQQQAMSAQSANINGVSGATFTSAAYAQALQSALDRLK